MVSGIRTLESEIKKEGSQPVSRVLCLPRGQVSVIYLSRQSPDGFSGLPSDMGRATLLTSVYMTLQLPRRTALVSPQAWWALTPPSHPYPDILAERGGCFLLRYSTLADSFLLGSGMLCVARTFLVRTEAQATDRPAAFCRQR